MTTGTSSGADSIGSDTGDGDGETGDAEPGEPGDGEPSDPGDGDGEPGDGDSDPGDGDGDSDPGDGDGDSEPGDGDGDLGPVCGDGQVDSGEACDDGNLDDTDACVDGCRLASCGDTFVHEGVEACDDGNLDDTDDCTSMCIAAACGDGFIQPGEACDDGNLDVNDGCSPMCEAELPSNPVTLCTNPNTAIPSSGLGTASAIHIPAGGTVTDVNVSITASHTWVGDLTWTLSKGDTSRVLINRVMNGGGNCSSDNIGVNLDDEVGGASVQVQCSNVPPAIKGDRAPNTALAGFDGASMVGDWSLQPNDFAVGDGGTFQQWCITIAWQ